MGYTIFTSDKVEQILAAYPIKRIVEYGCQNLYNQPALPAPYAKEWLESLGYEYLALDINGEHGALPINLSYPIDEGEYNLGKFDLLTDIGASEHYEIGGKFSWEAYYSAWLNKHNLTKIGGIIYSENPMSQNWPFHSFNYLVEDFYRELVQFAGYKILDLGTHAACHNTTDGWNVYCTLLKESEEFPTLDQFKTFSVKQS